MADARTAWAQGLYSGKDHLAGTASSMHRHLRRRRHVRVWRHQARHAYADGARARFVDGFVTQPLWH